MTNSHLSQKCKTKPLNLLHMKFAEGCLAHLLGEVRYVKQGHMTALLHSCYCVSSILLTQFVLSFTSRKVFFATDCSSCTITAANWHANTPNWISLETIVYILMRFLLSDTFCSLVCVSGSDHEICFTR